MYVYTYIMQAIMHDARLVSWVILRHAHAFTALTASVLFKALLVTVVRAYQCYAWLLKYVRLCYCFHSRADEAQGWGRRFS